MRHYSFCDQLLIRLDRVLQPSLAATASRCSPATLTDDAPLSRKEQLHAGRLMRINHVGEVCAQALYIGQSLTARSPIIKEKLQKAAQEEIDHLHWCQERLQQLESHPSYLNPCWYLGSLLIGITAGLLGDEVSLGFLAETEYQVERHLAKHLQSLPMQDKKSRAIIEKMRAEEMEHAITAKEAGAIPLPLILRLTMYYLSRLMCLVAYRI